MPIGAPSGSAESTVPFIEKTLEPDQPLRLFCPTAGQKVVDLGTFTVITHNGALRLVYQAPGNDGVKYAVATLSRDKTIKVGTAPQAEASMESLPIKLSAAADSEKNWVSHVSREHLVVKVKDGKASVTSVGSNGTVEGPVNAADIVTPRVDDIAAMPLSEPKPAPQPKRGFAGWFFGN